MGDTATLFRLVAASGLIGLLVYCSAYVVQIWRRRNARPADAAKAASRPRKIAWVCLFMGLILVGSAGVLRELTRSEGMLSGEDLFVVRASDDMTVDWLQEHDTVVAGETLARFGSGSRTARVEELRARLARAEAERDVLALTPLNPDPELTRRHQATSQERVQVQQELGQLIAASEAAERDITAQLLTKKESLARLERTLTERRKELDRATIRLRHAHELAESYARLRATRTVSEIEFQEQQKALREAEVEVASLKQELKDGQAEKELLKAHLTKLENGKADPAAPLQAQVAGLRTRLERLVAQEKEFRTALDSDLARSGNLRKAEMVQAVAKVREQKAAVDALAGEQEIRAPFSGRIAYRAASPNATRQRGPLLVLSPEQGFLLTARVPRSDVDGLRTDGEVALEVGDDSPERRIPARFRKAESLAHEPDQSALQLECQPPPEVVRRLAEGEKMAIAFAWRPPLTGMWPFQAGVVLSLVGAAGLYLTRPAANKTRSLARWAEPIPDSGPVLNGVAARFREIFRNGHVDSGHLAGVANGRRHGLVEKGAITNELETPDLVDELEEFYRDSLDRLNRAECPEEAARLLERLHQLRSTIRVLDSAPSSSSLTAELDGENHAIVGARP